MKALKSNVASLMLATLFSITSLSASAQTQESRVITGKVSDGKNAIANVAVTDGRSVVTTNENGVYTITAPIDARFVYISTPAGYKVPVADKTIPQFFKNFVTTKAPMILS